MSFERRALEHGAFALVCTGLAEIGVLGAFTERSGGVSASPFDSLNVSFSVGDAPDDVRANRQRIVGALGTDPFAVAGLVHGARIVRIDGRSAGHGFAERAEVIAACDGLITSIPGVGLAVTSADCVPMVLASARQDDVAVVHAGWRGISAGIVAAAAELFADPAAVRVAIGPAVGPDHYEVGEDVFRAVAAAVPGAVADRRDGALCLDLVGTIRAALLAVGIADVVDTGLCTACETARFYSHRRDALTGRQLALGVRIAR